MREMTNDEIKAFLLEGTRTGKLGWVSMNGAPHVAPVWFLLDGEDIVFNTHEDSGKAKALVREGRASLLVDTRLSFEWDRKTKVDDGFGYRNTVPDYFGERLTFDSGGVVQAKDEELTGTVGSGQAVGETGDRIVAHQSPCLLYTSPSPRDATLSRMPSSA